MQTKWKESPVIGPRTPNAVVPRCFLKGKCHRRTCCIISCWSPTYPDYSWSGFASCAFDTRCCNRTPWSKSCSETASGTYAWRTCGPEGDPRLSSACHKSYRR